MKKYFCMLLLTVFAFNIYGQQLKEKEYKLPADYIKKSKRQKTTGFMLLGGGVAIFTGGAIAMGHTQSKGENEFSFVVGGLAMSVASIPFFISSASNKHKAKVYMRKEALMLNLNIETGIIYNSIGVKINIGKG